MEQETELFLKKPDHRGDSIGWRESYWKLFFLHCSLSLLTHLCVQPHFCLDDQEHHVLRKMWIIRMIRGLEGRRRGANEHHRLHRVRSVFPHQWLEPSPLYVDIYFFSLWGNTRAKGYLCCYSDITSLPSWLHQRRGLRLECAVKGPGSLMSQRVAVCACSCVTEITVVSQQCGKPALFIC